MPVAYLIGAELAARRAGLIAAALVAVNPMLIWYSQEARSYALLVFFGGALAALLRPGPGQRPAAATSLALGLASALALCSHYFAVFPVGIEAVWLLVALRGRGALVLPALAGVGAAGLALAPLAISQVNLDPHRLDRKYSPLGTASGRPRLTSRSARPAT